MRKFAITSFILLLMIFDTFSKWFFDVPKWKGHFPILGDWLGIQLSYNQGVAFSLPLHGLPLQIVTIVLVLGLIFSYIRFEYPKKNTWIDTGFALIIAGALSHAYERIFVGHVVDFIAVKYFAILNFADIFISVGAFILFLYYGYFDRKHR